MRIKKYPYQEKISQAAFTRRHLKNVDKWVDFIRADERPRNNNIRYFKEEIFKPILIQQN